MPEVARELPAGVDPVLGRELEEIDASAAARAQFRHQRAAEAESGSGNRMTWVFLLLQ
jgi:hypothetical protein